MLKSKKQPVTLLTPENGQTVLTADARIVGKLDAPYSLGLWYDFNEKARINPIEPVRLSWESPADSFTVKLSMEPDLEGARVFHTKKRFLNVRNLLVGAVYYWQVTAHGAADASSPVFSFATARTPRFFSIPGIVNARDFGGGVTEDGKWRIRQGLVIRTAQLDGMTKRQKNAMNRAFGIKTDLDLREPNEAEKTGGVSPLGAHVKYLNIPGLYYQNIFGAEQYESFYREMMIFADPANYPIDVHCAGGKDRTGTVCFMLGALLGMSERDLCFAYEASCFCPMHRTNRGMLPYFDQMHTKFMELEGGTIAEKAEKYFRKIGMTDKEIAVIRKTLLEKNKS